MGGLDHAFWAGYWGLPFGASPAYVAGYQAGLDYRADRKGEGVACGRSWISRRKKCSKAKSAITPEENLRLTSEKQKARQALRRQVELAKGRKPYVKTPKDDPQEPASKRYPLHSRHAISTDARITSAKLEAALDAIDTPGAQERIALVRQIINTQGIQAVFNDTSSRQKRKTEAIVDQLDDAGYAGRVKRKVAAMRRDRDKTIEDAVTRTRQTAQNRGISFTAADEAAVRTAAAKRIDSSIKKAERSLVGNRGQYGGFTRSVDSFVTIKTDSKEKPTTVMRMGADGKIQSQVTPSPYQFDDFKISPGDAGKIVDRMISQHRDGTPDFVSGGRDVDVGGATRTLTVYLHEVGHQVRWAAGTPPGPRLQEAKRLTKYSRQDPDEYFAEHFVAWVLDANAYRAYDPVGADFIENSVRVAANAPKRDLQRPYGGFS